MGTGSFTLNDFMAQLSHAKSLGPMGKLIGMIPGMGRLAEQLNMDEAEVTTYVRRMRAIYNAMTAEERQDTELLGASRRHRIAIGAGVHVLEVSQFVKQFEMSRELMRQVSSMGVVQKLRVVMALATSSPVHRDPSYVRPAFPVVGWWVIALLLGVLALGVLWWTR